VDVSDDSGWPMKWCLVFNRMTSEVRGCPASAGVGAHGGSRITIVARNAATVVGRIAIWNVCYI
jgi:hypothetical protein